MSKPTLEEIRLDFDMGNKALWEKAAEYTETLLELLAAERRRREEVEREQDETLRMWREYKAAKDADVASADAVRERAEADNAAKDKAFAEYVEQYGVEHEEGCPEDDTCECPLVVALNDTFRAGEHPGAALLERMRALEKVRENVRPIEGRVRALVDFAAYTDTDALLLLNGIGLDDFPDVAQAQQVAALLDACAAYDALKEPHE